jgi:hypothetical protein
MTEENGDGKLVVPENFEDAIKPLEGNYLDFVKSAEGDLSLRLDRLLAERDLDATPRQSGIIALLASGTTSKKTAEVMGVDESTIYRIKRDPDFAPVIQELRGIFGERIFQWALGLVPHAFRALYDNLIHGDMDQRRLASAAVFRLIGNQLTPGPQSGPDLPPPPRVEENIYDQFKD